jgi:hypothetical protein
MKSGGMSGIGKRFPAQFLFGQDNSMLGLGNLPVRRARTDRQGGAIPRNFDLGDGAGAKFPCWQGIRVT